MKIRCFLLVGIFALTPVTLAAENLAEVEVEISLGKEPGFLSYRIKNVSNTEIVLGMMTCSRWDQWIIDSKSLVLSWPPGICDSNYCSPTFLKAGGFIEGTLPVRQMSASHRNVKARIGFNACQISVRKNTSRVIDEKIIWSNTLNVEGKSIPMLTEADKGRLNVGNKPPRYKGGVRIETK